MKKIIRNLSVLLALSVSSIALAQTKPAKWDLKSCIEYAHQNNIKVQKAKIAVEESKVDLKQSKAAYLPSLTASMSQNLDNAKSVTSNSFNSSMKGSYSLSSNMTLYNGGKTTLANQLTKTFYLPSRYIYMGTNIEASTVGLPTTRWIQAHSRRPSGAARLPAWLASRLIGKIFDEHKAGCA